MLKVLIACMCHAGLSCWTCAYSQPAAAIVQHYKLSEPVDTTYEELKVVREQLESHGRRPSQPSIPWDFSAGGFLRFAAEERGLDEAARQRIATAMNGFSSLRPPYSSLYCFKYLLIVGPETMGRKQIQKTLVILRTEAVRRWFIDHGYDATLIEMKQYGGVAENEVEWGFVGGLISNPGECEDSRDEIRRTLRRIAR